MTKQTFCPWSTTHGSTQTNHTDPYQLLHCIRLSPEYRDDRVAGRAQIIQGGVETMNQSRTSPHKDFAIDYDLMNFIKDTVKSAIEDAVQGTVDDELLLMLNGDGFKKRIEAIIDARLHVLAEEITVKTSGAGPGRGHKGRSHKKISLTLPETLYHQARELDGFFSGHVAAALELYLKLHKR
jgi:hypothetical protein